MVSRSRRPLLVASLHRRTACGSPNVLHLVLVGPLGAVALLTVAVALEIRVASVSLKSLTYRCIRMCEADRRAATWRIGVFQRDRRLDAYRWPLSRIPLRPLGLDNRRLELGGTSFLVGG
jgi:hypothetical protein